MNPRCCATQNGRLNSVRETLATLTTSAAGAGVGASSGRQTANNSRTLRFIPILPVLCSHGSIPAAAESSDGRSASVAPLQRCRGHRLRRSPVVLTREPAHEMLTPCWFPGVAPGRKEGTRAGCRWQLQSVAAPATVSGEPVVRVSHWETGKAGRTGNDPRARRPASAVTQPVGGGPHGAAVRSGDIDNRCEGRARCLSHDPKQEREAVRGRLAALRRS